VNSKDALELAATADLKRDLKRLNYMLQAAHRSSINIKNAYDFYTLAWKEFNKENLTDAFLYYDRSEYELTSSINDAKLDLGRMRLHSLRTISYFFKLYGLYAVLFGMLSALLFSYLIYRYAEISILNVPLWASFFAGLGSSAQILTAAVDDLRRDGMATRYKRVWYMAIPLLSIIFGYMAYLLFNSGLLAFNISSETRTFSTMLICFLAGFLTSWVIDRLSQLSRKM
jgi:hypothetical protein